MSAGSTGIIIICQHAACSLQFRMMFILRELMSWLRRASRMALPRTSAQQAFSWRWASHQAVLGLHQLPLLARLGAHRTAMRGDALSLSFTDYDAILSLRCSTAHIQNNVLVMTAIALGCACKHVLPSC